MTTVSSLPPRKGRNVELTLLLLAVGIVVLAYLNVGLATQGSFPPGLLAHGTGLLVISLAFHLVLRWRASYADPLLLPIVTLLNGLGLVMIHRLDLAARQAASPTGWRSGSSSGAPLAVVDRRRRALRAARPPGCCGATPSLAGAVGFGLLLLPLVPGLGRQVYGSRIWIGLGPFSFQPGEIAKIALAIFFAGYLVQTRDVLSLAGRKVLGFTLPRARDLGPILVAWLASLARPRLREGPRLLAALLRPVRRDALRRHRARAPGSPSAWSSSAGGAYLAYLLFGHVQQRVLLWLDTFSPQALAVSDQLANGPHGHGARVGSSAPGSAAAGPT